MPDDRPKNRPETVPGDKGDNSPRRGSRGLFLPGTAAGPGRPPTDKAFRETARGMSEAVLKKLFYIALKGNGAAAVRAAEAILDRAWGRPALEVSGPKGGPIGVALNGAVRRAMEDLVAQAEAENLAKPDDGGGEN